VKLREDQFHAGEARFWLDINGNPAPSVVHLNAAIGLNHDRDVCAVTGNRFVDRVVDEFPEAVHEASGIGRPDVHAGALSDSFEAF
jgi:hypothetical protein